MWTIVALPHRRLRKLNVSFSDVIATYTAEAYPLSWRFRRGGNS